MRRPAHQVIYTHGGGRLGNQVIRFVHWIAWARTQERRVEVLNFAFWPFAPYFEVWREHPGCVFPLRPGPADRWARRLAALPRVVREALEARQRLPRLLHTAGRLVPGWQAISANVAPAERLGLDDPEFLAAVSRRPVTTCRGWRIDTWREVARQQEELRPLFRPASAVRDRAEALVAPMRSRYDVVAGFFVRQSDYRAWSSGRFFFETRRYVDWLWQLLDLHAGKRLGFLIASEVAQDPEEFAGLPCVFASGMPGQGGHWMETWAELSQCDFIVTPPSTFSATAAWIGRIPLWPVLAGSQAMSSDQLIPDGLVGAARHPVFSLAVK